MNVTALGDPIRRKIAARMVELDLTMAQLSEAVGRSHAYIQQYLKRGIPRELRARERHSIARTLKIPETDLIPPNSTYKDLISESARMPHNRTVALPEQESGMSNDLNKLMDIFARLTPAGRSAVMQKATDVFTEETLRESPLVGGRRG